ncbi:MAG: methyltransferase domain-containing protein [Pyrinomonadaceae bacterium]
MFEKFRHRSHQLERLDTGDYTAAEYARWQREMRFVHGFWGERRALKNSLIRHARYGGQHYISVLDIGAGTGNILKLIKKDLSDRDVFAIAGETSADALGSVALEKKTTGIQPVMCSGLSLPFDDHSVDYVICTLVLHHLSDDDAMTLIGEMGRVARRRFFAIDLNRHPIGYYAWRAVSPLLFQRFTREDGALSILRSFTAEELLALAKRSGVSEVKVEHSRANRLVLSGR